MVDKNTKSSVGTVGKIYVSILLIIFGGIVLHAPLSVGFGTLWPQYSLLVKSWKEILMLFAGVMALYLLYHHKRFKLLKDPIMVAIEVYAALHLILLFYLSQGLQSVLAGLAIDLRYVLFFALVYIALKLYPKYRSLFIKVGITGALVVLTFALLQVFVLPKDILKYLGYNTNTISAYLTIDKNNLFIRINSTLRGPNPLGAYAGMVLAFIVAAISRHKIKKEKWPLVITAILSAGGVVALWASYSRTAWLGTLAAIIIILGVVASKKLSPKLWITIGITVLALSGILFVARDTSFVSNVILHDNPSGGSLVKSNEGHVSSLADGFNQLIHQPIGAGIGSTGSASILSNKTEIIENQYLFIAHEIGWLGLGLFIFIFAAIMTKLWKLRSNWLALGVLASGISLALIGILLPVWVDDTVSIIWWGLAAVVVGSRWYIVDGIEEKHGN